MATILYAEDDTKHRLMMRAALKPYNITLLEAINGEDAFLKAQQYRPDLILLDLFMPQVDGLSALVRLKESAHTNHIPVIILSAWPTGDNRERAARTGAMAFVAKPYNPVELAGYLNKKLVDLPATSVPQRLKTGTRPLNL